MENLLVSAKTSPKRLAGAILKIIGGSGNKVTLQAIGAGAVCQALKAIAIAEKSTGNSLGVVPGFTEAQVGGRKLTAIQFAVFRRI